MAIATRPAQTLVNLTASINLSPTIWTLFSLQWASRPLLNTSNENKILVSRCIMTKGATLAEKESSSFFGRPVGARGVGRQEVADPVSQLFTPFYGCLTPTLSGRTMFVP